MAYVLRSQGRALYWLKVGDDKRLDWRDLNLLTRFIAVDHSGLGWPFFSFLQLAAEEEHTDGSCRLCFYPYSEILSVEMSRDYAERRPIEKLSFWPIGHKSSMLSLNDFLLLLYSVVNKPAPAEVTVGYKVLTTEGEGRLVRSDPDFMALVLYEVEN